ncbi:MAG: peptidylprolyl isomerase [Lachnospiraceae bacterium]|nr:peptidylprolyl isomerase [Lachnospiraceae bacterium]
MEENKRKKQGKRKAFLQILAFMLAAACIFTACRNGEKSEIRIVAPLSDSELFKIGDEVCSVPEAMILVTAQKKVVEDVYGKEIWSVKSDGITFEENVKISLKDFLARMKCMKLMAAENGISLSAEEEKILSACTETYLSQLTEKEKKALSLEKTDVREMFTSYYYYNKLMEVLTSDMEMEISDNDARIMQIECIFVKKTGKDLSKRLADILKKAREKDKFAETAKKYDEGGKTAMSISRGQLPKELEQTVFSMTDGQISDALETAEGYYIIRCVKDYDRDATAKHKTELIKELKEKSFTEQYDDFVEKLTAQFNQKAWNRISLPDAVSLSKADFFAIYNENIKK